MREAEARLGRTLEEDYREYYIGKQWGQAKLADRWRVPRGLILNSNHRIRSQSWIAKLNLPKRNAATSPPAPKPSPDRCEICGHSRAVKAHWIAHKHGCGKQRFNIISLCPNHHQLLDADDPFISERAKQLLLFREAKRIIETGKVGLERHKELVRVCQAIITRTID
jgi:hypothetical protein